MAQGDTMKNMNSHEATFRLEAARQATDILKASIFKIKDNESNIESTYWQHFYDIILERLMKD
jgi:hypothetical protein